MRSPRNFKRRTRALVGTAVFATVGLGSGTASAYFTATAHTGSGSAATASVPSITTSSPTLSASLYPGATVDLTVTITNHSTQSWKVTGLVANGNATGGGGSCTASFVSVASSPTFTPTTIAAGNSTTMTFTKAVTMSSSAPNTCQNQSFTVPVSVTGQIG